MSGYRSRFYSNSSPGGGVATRPALGFIAHDQIFPKWNFGQCDDTSGFRESDNYLDITKIERSVVPVNGSYNFGGGDVVTYHNVIPPVLAAINPGHLTFSASSDAVVATHTVAVSNPTHPAIQYANFVYEMKDLPEMIRDLGNIRHLRSRIANARAKNKFVAKYGPSAYLSFQMGWVPLLSDLKNLLEFQKQVDSKMETLDRLFNKNGGLHRSVGKPNSRKGFSGEWSGSATEKGTITIDSHCPGIVMNADYVTTTSWQKWGSCRWKATSLPSTRYTDKQLRRVAASLVYGGGVPTKAIWDAIPWTWMIDWFVNVGDFLSAYNNTLPLVNTTPCVMTHIRTETVYTPIGLAAIGWSGGNGSIVLENKHRQLQPATLTASIPFLGTRQLSILGALHLQRLR